MIILLALAAEVPPPTDPAVAIAAAVAAALAQEAATNQTNMMIVNAILTFMGLLVTGAVTVLVTMINTKVKETQKTAHETHMATEIIAVNSSAQAESTEKIHLAVNSEREATRMEIKALNDRILDLSKIIAKFEQVKVAAAAAAKDKP